MEPIISEELVDFGRRMRKVIFPCTPDLRNGWKSKMHLSICLHVPVILFPQNSTSSNVILCNLGDLTVENFFKEQSKKDDDNIDIVDNILAKWDAINVSRAIMTLDGTLVIQVNIQILYKIENIYFMLRIYCIFIGTNGRTFWNPSGY